MRNFLLPEELMRNYTKFKLHRAPSTPQWNTPLKNLLPRLFGFLNPGSQIIRKIHSVSLICLAIVFLGTGTSLRAQTERKQDQPQPEGEPKKDKEQGKKEETKS